MRAALSVHTRERTSSQTIITFVGEDVTLPCHLKPASDAVSKSVEWRRLDLDPTNVHVWNEGQNHLVNQNPSYKGRTALSTGKLRRGDFSLKLSRVKHSDSGTYTCYFPSEVKRSTVELLVRKNLTAEPTVRGSNASVMLRGIFIPLISIKAVFSNSPDTWWRMILIRPFILSYTSMFTLEQLYWTIFCLNLLFLFFIFTFRQQE
uniref:Ig-like domain-containing protein n=1 Tax=Astatotilapia calliptera TaxID=8154 RepID=A0A3P8NT55_ASTCA